MSKLHNSQKLKLLLSLNNIVDKHPDRETASLTKQIVSHLLENATTTMNEDVILDGLTKKIYLDKNLNTFTKRKFETVHKIRVKEKPKQLNKELSAKEKRSLHLRQRKPDQVSYSDALTIWRHWCTYVEQMDWHEDKESFNAQLNRIDMNGVLLRIVQAKNPSLVAVQGIVIMDRKCTFTLVTEQNAIKVIPKAGCVFEIFWTRPDNKTIELYGKYMCIRPEERSNRKVRTTMVPVL